MTTSSGASTVLSTGELFIEYPDDGVGYGKSKIKVGDGVPQRILLYHML